MSHRLYSLAKTVRHCPTAAPDLASWDPVDKWTPRYQTQAARVRANDPDRHIPQYGSIVSYQLGALFSKDCQ